MELYFRKYGGGSTPLLILHGVFGMLDNWHSLAKKFSEKYTVYAIDLRNHGHSPHSDEMGYEVMANDIFELVEKEKLEKVVLLGHSMGGKVAMKFAAMHPEMLHGLIVADIAPKRYKPGHLEIIAALKGLDFKVIATRTQATQALSQSIDEGGVIHFLLKNLTRKDDGGYGLKMNLEAIENSYDEIIGEIEFGWPLNIPTLFLKGANSRYIKPKDEAEIEQWFTEAEFETVSDSGHWLHADNPIEFQEKVEAFIDQL